MNTPSPAVPGPQGPGGGAPQGWSPLLDALPVGVMLADAEGRYLEANPAASEILGVPREALLASRLPEPRACHLRADGTPLPSEDTPGAVVLRTGVAIHRQVLGWARGGDTLWLELSAEPVPGGGALVSFEDVTERRIAEGILSAHGRIVDLAARATLAEVLVATLDEAEALTGSCIGFYHFVDDDQDTLTLQAWSTRTARDFCRAEGAGLHYPVHQAGVWVDALRHRTPVIHNDYPSMPNRRGLPEGHAEVLRELVVPVVRGDRIVALLGVGNKPSDYGQQDLRTVQRLADLAWDAAERKRGEAALAASEARSRSMLRTATDAVWLLDLEGRFLEVNQAACLMLGYSREELLGLRLSEVEAEESPEETRRHIDRLTREGSDTFESRHRRKDGSTFPVEISSTVLQDTRQMVAYVRDISGRKEAEARAARWQQMFARAGMAVVLVDTATNTVLECNRAFAQQRGYEPAEMAGMSIFLLAAPDNRDRMEAFSRQVDRAGHGNFEGLHVRKDGTVFPVMVDVTVVRDAEGRPAARLGFSLDLSERKRAEDALRESESRLRAVIENSQDAIGVSRAGIHTMVNPAYVRMFGFESEGQLLGTPIMDIIAPESREQVLRHSQDRVAGRPAPTAYEVTALHRDGSRFGMDVRASTYTLEGQVHNLVILRDITARKEAEAAIQQSEARYRSMFEDSPVGIWEEDFSAVKAGLDALREAGVTDLRAHLEAHPEEVLRLAGQVRVLAVNKASVRDFKGRSGDAILHNLPTHFTPRAVGVFREELLALAAGRTRFRGETLVLDAEGSPLDFDLTLTVQAGYEATLARVLVTFVDITDRKRREEERAESLRVLQHLESIDRIIHAAGEDDFEAMNGGILEVMLALFGCDRAWLVHPADPEAPGWRVPLERTTAAYPGALVSGTPIPLTEANRAFLRTAMAAAGPLPFGPGHPQPVPADIAAAFGVQSMLVLPLRLKQGDPWLLGMHQCDRARAWTGEEERVLAQIGARLMDGLNALHFLRELRASEERYRMLAENSADVIWTVDLDTGRFTYVSPSVYGLRGLTPEEVMAQSMADALTPESAGRVARVMHERLAVLRADDPSTWISRDEVDQFRKDGSIVHTEVVTRYLPDAEGRFRSILGVSRDITEAKRAEEERRRLEAQIQRAQKMDSLGSLAGGVAHDMNNVLGAIMALASLHQAQAPGGSGLQHAMETITKACERGRTLVQGLLGFARQGLAGEEVLDLNALVEEQAALLSRTTLQKVEVLLDLQQGLHPIEGDPSVLSQILMNLSVNAVDAMPGGGTLTLRTRNQGPDAVDLEIQDTGTGMPPEVLARATDPFFTTKPQGKGTGLGLAIVYGAVKAHHGRMDIRSAEGQGTTIAIRFPASAAAAPPAPPAPQAQRAPSAPLRVLVVDDDDLVQASLGSVLEALGHAAEGVSSGEEALRLLEEGRAYEVAILDLNMPGLGGEGTLPRLRALRPALPVLLSTGRITPRAADLAQRTPGVALIPKPFSLDDLKRLLADLPRP